MKYRIFGTIGVLAVLVILFLATGQDAPKGQVNSSSSTSAPADTSGFGSIK